MLKKTAIPILILAIISACAGEYPHETEGEPPLIPTVIIVEQSHHQIYQEVPPDEIQPPDQDILPYNEYAIFLDFDPTTRTIHGIENISFTNRSSFSFRELVFRLPLNAHGYNTMEISHISSDNEELNFTQDATNTTLVIHLQRPLEPDETTQIQIRFEAYLSPGPGRSGANNYAMWAGAFLPTEAVFSANGWHTEAFYPVGNPFILDTAIYSVEITTPLGYTVAGTGTKTEDYFDGQRITTLNTLPVRDFAFAISPNFRRASQVTPSGVEILLYHYSTLPTERILNAAVETMTFFEEVVGAYPYPQLTIVEADVDRSESFSSIIFVSSNHLRGSQPLGGLRNGIGRQWFSVIIGANRLEEAWLTGGLTYFLQGGLLGRPAELRTLIENDHAELTAHMHFITNEESRRLATHIREYDSWSDYLLIQHRKARIMFYALYREMGEESFRSLLREYYTQFAFQIAKASDFIEIAESIHGQSLQGFFDYWLYTTGLPPLPSPLPSQNAQ